MMAYSEKGSLTPIRVQGLSMAYGEYLVQRDISFTIKEGEVFIVMGENGCGKSTLMKHMVGLIRPRSGNIKYGEADLWGLEAEDREDLMRGIGILYQSGALWSSMTIGENVALALEQFTDLSKEDIDEIVAVKLALVGLAGVEALLPTEVSGGMRKRASLARALALEPSVLFFDEPSSGLDPVNARLLDDLILRLRDSLGTTIVVVSHDLASIFAIADDTVFLDTKERTMVASGPPKRLMEECDNATVRQFLTRGGESEGSMGNADHCMFSEKGEEKGGSENRP
jgi:phospholipid/cholesterol/gamma-HCH transport system ATP-binding protein